MVIYFSRSHPNKLVTMQNQYYDAFIEKIEEYEGKKYLMVDDYTLEKVLNKITRIGIEKLYHWPGFWLIQMINC